MAAEPETPVDRAPRRPVPFGVAVLPLIAVALLLGIGYGVYKIKPQVLLIAAAFLTGLLGAVLKFTWAEMEQGIVESIRKAMPAILIEGGYMSNPGEGGKIFDPAYRRQMARAIVEGILAYKRTVNG